MVVVMKPDFKRSEMNEVVRSIESVGLNIHVMTGRERTLIGILGNGKELSNMCLERMAGVEKVVPIRESYKLANRSFKSEDTVIDIHGVKIGGKEITIIAGPCAVENRKQIIAAASGVKKAGAQILRGGAFKPRTSPYAFQGLEEEGLKLLKEAKESTGLLIVTEVTSEYNLEIADKYVDMFQIGARNVQNFQLLKEAGRHNKPVLLKRGSSTTIDELLNAAEYIMSEGNHRVILCERGIRTFEEATRNTLDISAVPVIKRLSHLPVIVDPSHAGGNAAYVPALSRAAIAAGADGIIIEVHPNPKEALSDASQQITPDVLGSLNSDLKKIAEILGRELKLESLLE